MQSLLILSGNTYFPYESAGAGQHGRKKQRFIVEEDKG
jgi:hypothetical protein